MSLPVRVSALHIYPVKSLRGIRVEEAVLDDLGLVGDRRFLVVSPDGRFLTQRTVPRVALINTGIGGGILALSSGGATYVEVPLAPDPEAPLISVEVWKSSGLQAEDCGEEAAAWLSDFLKTSCRLVRIGPAFHRAIPEHKRPPRLPAHAPARVGFADAFPALALGLASLESLNTRLAEMNEAPVPADRFRANILFTGGQPHAEDIWKRIRIGTTLWHAAGPCARCIVTTTDQETAERSPEPLRTLAGYRRDPVKQGDVNFGQNWIHEAPGGHLRVGDALTVLD